MAAGTTNAMRPPGRNKLAVTSRNGAQDAVNPVNSAPSLALSLKARSRTSPLNVW